MHSFKYFVKKPHNNNNNNNNNNNYINNNNLFLGRMYYLNLPDITRLHSITTVVFGDL